MWCHLCAKDFADFQDFKIHIIEVHRKGTGLYKEESSESEESEQIKVETSENASSNIHQGSCYDSNSNILAKNKSDNGSAVVNMSQENESDSYDKRVALSNSQRKDYSGKNKTSVLNTSVKKQKLRSNMTDKSGVNEGSVSNKLPKRLQSSSIFKKKCVSKKKKKTLFKKVLPKRRMPAISNQEDSPKHSDGNQSDHSEKSFNGDTNHFNFQPAFNNSIIVNTESLPFNSYDGSAVTNMSQEIGFKSDNSMSATNISDEDLGILNESSERSYDSDHNITAESNSDGETDALNNSQMKNSNDEDKTSVLKTPLKRLNLRSNTANKSGVNVVSVSNKLPKRLQSSSIFKKKLVSKKKKKKVLKKVLPKRKMRVISYQEDSPKHSDSNQLDHSENSCKEDSDYFNFQPASCDSIAEPECILSNNYGGNSQCISNNPVFVVNPYVGQGANNCTIGNQTVQASVYVINTVAPNSTTSMAEGCFDFTSSNILKWLTEHKELCKSVPYPLSLSMFQQTQTVLKAIFDAYQTGSISGDTNSVLDVYEELDCMVHKHVNSR